MAVYTWVPTIAGAGCSRQLKLFFKGVATGFSVIQCNGLWYVYDFYNIKGRPFKGSEIQVKVAAIQRHKAGLRAA